MFDVFKVPPWYKWVEIFLPFFFFFKMKLDWTELTPVDLCFRCVIAHSLITSSGSNLNWQKQLIIPFVFGASVLSGLRLKVNGLHWENFDQLYQELIGRVETNAKSK